MTFLKIKTGKEDGNGLTERAPKFTAYPLGNFGRAIKILAKMVIYRNTL